jgi:hypothetical protein
MEEFRTNLAQLERNVSSVVECMNQKGDWLGLLKTLALDFVSCERRFFLESVANIAFKADYYVDTLIDLINYCGAVRAHWTISIGLHGSKESFTSLYTRRIIDLLYLLEEICESCSTDRVLQLMEWVHEVDGNLLDYFIEYLGRYESMYCSVKHFDMIACCFVKVLKIDLSTIARPGPLVREWIASLTDV